MASGELAFFVMPMVAGWIVLLALACIGAAVVFRAKPRPPESGFSVIDPGAVPGRFRIHGVNRATRLDAVWECEADSEANARVKGELEGIIVTRVERF